MTSSDEQQEQTLRMRRKAEERLREQAARSNAALEDLSPEDIRQMLHELQVHQIELEMQNEELRRARVELEAVQERYFDLYDLAPVSYITVGESGLVAEANLTAATLLGVVRSRLVKQPFSRFILREDQDRYYRQFKRLHESGEPRECDLRMVRGDGTVFWVHLTASVARDDAGATVFRIVLLDISERKFHEELQALSVRLIELANAQGDMRRLMSEFTAALQDLTGCEAVGIRLRAGDDYPYYETRGFPHSFVLVENRLCAYGPDGTILRDGTGNPVLECMCGNILCGRFNPALPLFTSQGSFWTNSTTALLAGTTEADRQARTRNRCNGEGYESVALIPLRSGSQVFGLLQFNDHRPDRFSADMISHLEILAGKLAIALSRRQAEQALQQSRDLLEAIEQISRVGGWEWDVERQTMVWTGETYRIHGLVPGEFQPGAPEHIERSLTCYDPADRPVIEGAFRRCVEKGDCYDLEFPLTTADGRRVWIKTMARPVLEGERVVKVLGNIMDITARKTAEQELSGITELLRHIRAAQSCYIVSGDPQATFDTLLQALVAMTDSEFGFLDEVLTDSDGSRYKLSLALSNIAWDEESRNLYGGLKARSLQFRNLNNLAGLPALTGEVLIANDVPSDPRSGGVPPGHPGLRTFMALPLYFGNQLVGVAGVANRAGGYDESMSRFLEPFLSTCASIIHASRHHAGEREAVAALRESEANLREAQAIARMGRWEFDHAENRLEWSDGIFDQFEVSRETFAATYEAFMALVHPDDRALVDQAYRSSVENRAPYEIEHRLLMPDGRIKWVIEIGRTEYDDAGNAVRSVGTVQDITDRKRAEDELREAEARLRLSVSASNVGLWDWTPATDEVYYSREWKRQLGYLDDEISSRFEVWQSRVHPDDLEATLAHIQRCLADSTENYTTEFRMRHKDGSYRWMVAQAQIFRDEAGKAVRVMGCHIDITDRKRTETALKASLAEKEVLLREVHHRVKNNLAAINGLLDLQKGGITDEAALAAFSDLSGRIVSMALVHERLYQSEDMARIDFQDYLSALTCQLLTSFGVQSHIRCIVEATGVEVGLDTAIPIGLIVNELVTNAMKHAFPPGETRQRPEGCEITITMREDEDVCTLIVADNGIGLPPGLDWRTCPSLGLRLVRMLGEYQLGGQFQFDRTEGTRFVFRFKNRFRKL